MAGGSQVRWRTVFRSDGLETVSPRGRELMVEELRVAKATPSPTYDQTMGDFPAELRMFFDLGVDGIFTTTPTSPWRYARPGWQTPG